MKRKLVSLAYTTFFQSSKPASHDPYALLM